MKRYLKNLQVALLGFCAAALLRLLYPTYRWHIAGLNEPDADWPAREPRIMAFWHGHQLLMPWLYRSHRAAFAREMTVLISEHRDGRLIAKAMNYFGIRSVAGSSTRGGKEALFRLIDILKQGQHISITPDGPKGPINKVKAGIIRISQRSGAAIIPVAAAADRAWRSRSWDGMFLPKPFARVGVVFGDKLYVPPDSTQAQVNQLCRTLEEALSAVSESAMALLQCGDRSDQDRGHRKQEPHTGYVGSRGEKDAGSSRRIEA